MSIAFVFVQTLLFAAMNAHFWWFNIKEHYFWGFSCDLHHNRHHFSHQWKSFSVWFKCDRLNNWALFISDGGLGHDLKTPRPQEHERIGKVQEAVGFILSDYEWMKWAFSSSNNRFSMKTNELFPIKHFSSWTKDCWAMQKIFCKHLFTFFVNIIQEWKLRLQALWILNWLISAKS